MLTTLTPSPLSDAVRASLQSSLQPVLYGLVMLTGECRQTVFSATGTLGGSIRTPAFDLGTRMHDAATAIAAHMTALGLPVDTRVDGASDNNPFDGSFDAGDTDPAILGAALLNRCRLLAVLIRTAFAAASTAGAMETLLELQAVALTVSRLGGQLAQTLR